MDSTAPQPNAPRNPSLRTAAAAASAALATSALMFAGVGLLDRFTSQTPTGAALLWRGLALTIVAAVAALVLLPKVSGAGRKLVVVSIGIFPFATFAAFIVWRAGVSDVQRAACEAGDAVQCRVLAERRARRGKDDEAMPLFVAGCELGDGRACAALAFRSQGEERTRYLSASCEAGTALACATLGAESEGDARARWMARACELGDDAACTPEAQR